MAGLPARLLAYRGFRTRPLWVTLDVTWNCNCRCEYCNYWREGHDDLSTDEMLTVIRNLRSLGTAYLGISGGEPLLRKDISELVAFAKQCGMYVGLNTNGMIGKEELYRSLMAHGLDTMCFSIDGASPETHERFRKHCPFERVTRSIETAVRVRDGGRHSTQISTNTVVHRGNVDELEAVAQLGRRLGADRHNFQPIVTSHLEDSGARQRMGFSREDRELLERVQAALARLPGGNLEGFIDLIVDFYTGGKGARSMSCYAGRAFAYVDPRGTLYPCSVLMEPLASLLDPDWAARLRSAESQATLRKAAEQRCSGCSLVCYMERNVMLNNALNPRMWREVLFKRYAAAGNRTRKAT
jgi:pyrroloquinoline quinone biosynthesis protein E